MEKIILLCILSLSFFLSCLFWPKSITLLFVFVALTTEFLWIEIYDSIFRLAYFIASILILAFFIKYYKNLPKLLRSSKALFIFLIYMIYTLLITSLISPNKVDSFKGFILFLIMFSHALLVYILLVKFKAFQELRTLFLLIFTLSIAFSILQFAYGSLRGVAIAWGPTQIRNILVESRMPSFFTEADTFGKYLMSMILFFFPAITETSSFKDRLTLFFGVIILFTINLTRSAIVGLIIGILAMVLILTFRGEKIGLILKLPFVFLFLFGITYFILMATNRLFYLERVFFFVSPRSIIRSDPSAIFRYESIEKAFSVFLKSGFAKNLFGTGWAGLAYEFGAQSYVGSSNLFVNIIIYSGILGFILFIWSYFRILVNLYKFYITYRDKYALGVFSALIGASVASLMAPMMLAPEYWFLIGMGFYYDNKISYTQGTIR